jgi:glucose-1-phosphate thymidylyltransferase
MHETAVVQNAVIGPFVNLEANAVVRDSIVRNSLIGVGTHVTDAILDGSLIGDKVRISGRASKLIVGDEGSVELHKEEL